MGLQHVSNHLKEAYILTKAFDHRTLLKNPSCFLWNTGSWFMFEKDTSMDKKKPLDTQFRQYQSEDNNEYHQVRSFITAWIEDETQLYLLQTETKSPKRTQIRYWKRAKAFLKDIITYGLLL